VRRETGKEYGVKVSADKDLASHIDPKPCVGAREGAGEASAGACIGRPLSPVKSLPGADAVDSAEGNTEALVNARAQRTRRGQRTRHVQKFLVWEPGDLRIDLRDCDRSASGRPLAERR
jgi:hypothetical protein